MHVKHQSEGETGVVHKTCSTGRSTATHEFWHINFCFSVRLKAALSTLRIKHASLITYKMQSFTVTNKMINNYHVFLSGDGGGQQGDYGPNEPLSVPALFSMTTVRPRVPPRSCSGLFNSVVGYGRHQSGCCVGGRSFLRLPAH